MGKRLAALIGAVLGVIGLALGTSGIANASLLPQYQVVKGGTAGYYGIGSFENIGATVTPRAAAVNIGGVGTGGIGTQLCDPNNGFGLQLGLVSNGSTFTVEYAAGTLAGASADACVGNGVLANPHVIHQNLASVQVGDPVQLYTSFTNYRTTVKVKSGKHWVTKHVWRGRATFEAFDWNSVESYSATVSGLAADWSLSNAGAGVQQDTTGMSACTPVTAHYTGGSGACNDVADFSGVFVNGFGGLFGGGPGLASHPAIQVITTGGGLKANAATVAPNDTLTPTSGLGESSFSVFAGEVLG